MNHDALNHRMSVEREERWREDFFTLPKLKFKPEWEVQIMPPFGGATARFAVYKGEKRISVYMDHFDRLGCVGQPYFELYPNADGDCSRYYLTETEEMMAEIEKLLDESEE